MLDCTWHGVVYFDQRLGAAHSTLQTLVEIVIFNVFATKNQKKARNLQQILAKNSFFKFALERWSAVFFPKKHKIIVIYNIS